MDNSNAERFPTRLASLIFVDFLCNFVIKIRRKNLNVDYEDILITFFIASRSMRSLLDNRYNARNFGFEEAALPQDERIAVSVKEIVSSLHIPRETVRRKLLILLDRNMIVKVSDGYIFPPQVDGRDITTEFRKFIEVSMKEFLRKLDLINQIR